MAVVAAPGLLGCGTEHAGSLRAEAEAPCAQQATTDEGRAWPLLLLLRCCCRVMGACARAVVVVVTPTRKFCREHQHLGGRGHVSPRTSSRSLRSHACPPSTALHPWSPAHHSRRTPQRLPIVLQTHPLPLHGLHTRTRAHTPTPQYETPLTLAQPFAAHHNAPRKSISAPPSCIWGCNPSRGTQRVWSGSR
jgi:hypothetical protein